MDEFFAYSVNFMVIIMLVMMFAAFVSFFMVAVLRSRVLWEQYGRELRKRRFVLACFLMGLASGSALCVSESFFLFPLRAQPMDVTSFVSIAFLAAATTIASSGTSALGWLLGTRLQEWFRPGNDHSAGDG